MLNIQNIMLYYLILFYLFCQVFFCVLIGAFALGNAFPNLQNLASARGAAYTIYGIMDNVSYLPIHLRAGLYGLYGPRCPLSPERPSNLITHSLTHSYTLRSIHNVVHQIMLLQTIWEGIHRVMINILTQWSLGDLGAILKMQSLTLMSMA